jgi:hypothetical protein
MYPRLVRVTYPSAPFNATIGSPPPLFKVEENL